MSARRRRLRLALVTPSLMAVWSRGSDGATAVGVCAGAQQSPREGRMKPGHARMRRALWAAVVAAACAVSPDMLAQSRSDSPAAEKTRTPAAVRKQDKASTRSTQATSFRSAQKRLKISSLGRMPLTFEENRGQLPGRVKYLSRGKGYALALTGDDAVLAVAKKTSAVDNQQSIAAKGNNAEAGLLRMRFAGGNAAAKVEGLDALRGTVYYVTDERIGPLTGSRMYRRVRYAGVYPGIDAVYHGDNERLEFDFVVAPHGDPKRIRLAFTGPDQILLADNGDLVLRVAGEEVRLLKPFIYQELDGARHEIPGGFLLHEDSTATFAVGDYDPSRPLVIDPTIHFATYIGSGVFDDVRALETDATGAIYLLGNLGDVVSGGATISFPFWTTYSDFFTGAGQSGCYLAKLRPDGSGGVNYDYVALFPGLGCEAMAVGTSGVVSIAGPNGSPLQTVVQTFEDTGGSLFRTNVNHLPLQRTRQLRMGSAGNVYALGLCSHEATPGTLYPLPGGFQSGPEPGLCNDPSQIGGLNSQSALIVTDAAGQIIYGTFLGDGFSAFETTALEIDGFGKAYIAGQTDSGLNLVTADAFQPQPGDTNCTSNCGPGDAFVMVIDPAQPGISSLSYSSYFGGTNQERDVSMALDPAGMVYLAGNTDSRSSFPGAGFNDNAIFLSVLDLSQWPNQLLSTVAVVESPATTLLPWLESGSTLRLMDNGWVALMADSTDSSFPLVNPLFSGPYDVNAPNPLRPLLLVYDPLNATFPFATFLDDAQLARFPHIATYGADNLYVAMVTTETNRSTDGSPTLGQEDVLLFGISSLGGSSSNQPPTVFVPFFTPVLHADSPSGVTLSLTAIAFDPDGDPLTYSWTGPFTDNPVTTAESVTARLALGLQQTVTVTVTDDHGNSTSASITVDVIGVSCAGGAATPVDSSINAGVFQYAPLTFTAAGATAGTCEAFLTTRLDQNPPTPSNLQGGSPPIYFEVTTSGTASFVVPFQVCIDTRGMSFPNPSSIRLYHFDQTGQLAFWNDITTAGYPQGNQVCGQTNSLGTFAIFYPQVPQTAIETIAGNGIRVGELDGPGGDPADDFVPGPALSTPLGYLSTGAFDRASNILYFTDLGGFIRKLDLDTNTISTVAGNGVSILGAIDGPGGDLRDDLVDGGDPFNTFIGQPHELALHPNGDLVFFDRYTCLIRRLDVAQNRVFLVAGNGNCGFSGDGGPAAQAALSVANMALDAAGNLFVADGQNARVRRIDGASGTISTVAGNGSFGIPASGSPFSVIGFAQALAFDAQGHLLIASGMDLMRMSPGADGLIDGSADETLTLINGCHTNCQQPFGGDGLPINHAQVFLANVQHMSVAQDGALLLQDVFRIRRVAPGADGIVTGASDEVVQTVASYFDFRPNSGANFNGDTFATQSYLGPFSTPFEDNQGRIVVVDPNNYRIRRFGLAPSPGGPPSADLEILVGDTPDPVNAGDVLTYTVTVVNHGPNEATGVVLTHTMSQDALFDGVDSGNLSCTTPAPGTSGTVVCDLATMGSGTGAAVEISVKPQTPGALTGSFIVSAMETDPNADNNSVSETTIVNLAPAVITVAEVIVVTDAPALLPSAMIGVNENIVVTDAPALLPSAMVAVSEQITVTDALNIPTTADLSIAVSAAPATVDAGATVRYTVTVANGGPATASDVVIFIPVAGAFTVGAVDAPAATCRGNIINQEWTLTCQLDNAIPSGGQYVMTIDVTPTAAGTLSNTFSVRGIPSDPVADNNQVTVDVAVNAAADLAIVVVPSRTLLNLNDALTYAVTVTNNGPMAAPFAGAAITLPNGFALDQITLPGLVCTTLILSSTWTCGLGDIAPGATVQFSVIGRVTAGGAITSTFAVAAGTLADPVAANNTASVTVTVNRPPVVDAGPDRDLVVSTSPAGIQVSAAATDPDGDPIQSIQWFNGATFVGNGAVAEVQLQFGTHTLTAVASDSRGGQGRDDVTIIVRPAVLDRPAFVSADPNAPQQVTVSWVPVVGAAEYRVYRDVDVVAQLQGSPPAIPLAWVLTGNARLVATVPGTSFVDTGLPPLVRQFYAVVAVNGPTLSQPTATTAEVLVQAEPNATIVGFADMHNHQFANLGFAGRLIHGEATGPIDSALESCEDTHGQGGLQDPVGSFLTGSLGHDTRGFNPASFAEYISWPSHNSRTHQQAHYEMVKRAFDGGQRLMVMHAESNKLLCQIVTRDPLINCDDMTFVETQLNAAKALETYIDSLSGGPGKGWYRIAYSGGQARQIINAGKMAVVLGIEVDELFRCGRNATCTFDDVRQRLDYFHSQGVRHLFPVGHFDNAFGGAAMYNTTFTFGNWVTTGSFLTPRECGAEGYRYAPNLSVESAIYIALRLLLGQPPSLPPFPDPPFVADCNNRTLTGLGDFLVREMMARGMIIDIDHMSALTANAVLTIAEQAEYPGVVSGHSGPLMVSGGSKANEGAKSSSQLTRIYGLGGLAAVLPAQGDRAAAGRPDGVLQYDGSVVNDCGQSSKTFAQAYLAAVDLAGGPANAAVAIGTDFNGFGGQPGPRFGQRWCPGDASPGAQLNPIQYPFNIFSPTGVDAGRMSRSVTPRRMDGTGTTVPWDFNEDGLAHAGLIPDLIDDLRRVGVSDDYLRPLFRSAEAYVRMWEEADGSNPAFTVGTILLPGIGVLYQATSMSGAEQPVTVTFGSIDGQGRLVAEPMENSPAPPDGYVFATTVFDLFTTAPHTPPIVVCINGQFLPGDRLFHFESVAWADITLPEDSTAGRMCGRSSSFSPFAVVRSVNRAPTADAGEYAPFEATSPAGATVTLAGSGTDPDDDALTFTWTEGGVTLGVGQTIAPLLALGDHDITLTVDDGRGGIATATTRVIVRDTTAPSIALTVPANGATYTLNQVVTSEYSCSDSATGVAACAGPVPSGSAVDTGTVGLAAFTVNAADHAGNASTASSQYRVEYGVCLLYDPTKAKKSGSTIPIKLQLCDAARQNYSSPGIRLTVQGVALVATGDVGQADDAGNANPDDAFRYDSAFAGYIFNLKATGYAQGVYRLLFTIGDDPAQRFAEFRVR